jgi:predicted transcriptional regulator
MTSRVGDVMTPKVVSFRRHAQFKDIVQVMRECKADGLTAAQLMTRPAMTISSRAWVAEAARTMYAKHVKRLPVVSED